MIFRYYPEIPFTSIFDINNHEKKFLDTEKISFSKADFYEVTFTFNSLNFYKIHHRLNCTKFTKKYPQIKSVKNIKVFTHKIMVTRLLRCPLSAS